MNYINAIIFGLIQGLTEFLPVSSSGHSVILHNFISVALENELAFDVSLHAGTLLALVIFFRKDISGLLRFWFLSLRGEKSDLSRISWLIILGTVPAGLAGYFWSDLIEFVFRSILVVAVMLIVIGILFLIVEAKGKKNKEMKELDWKSALIIGLAQALALIPGTSRSGITIIAGMATGLKREVAVRFSFLLSIPIILGAVIKEAPQIIGANLILDDYLIIFAGFMSAFIFGWLAIKYFLAFSQKYTLKAFAIYRFILAVVLLFYIFY